MISNIDSRPIFTNLNMFGQVWTSLDTFRQIWYIIDQVWTITDNHRQCWKIIDKFVQSYTKFNNFIPFLTALVNLVTSPVKLTSSQTSHSECRGKFPGIQWCLNFLLVSSFWGTIFWDWSDEMALHLWVALTLLIQDAFKYKQGYYKQVKLYLMIVCYSWTTLKVS